MIKILTTILSLFITINCISQNVDDCEIDLSKIITDDLRLSKLYVNILPDRLTSKNKVLGYHLTDTFMLNEEYIQAAKAKYYYWSKTNYRVPTKTDYKTFGKYNFKETRSPSYRTHLDYNGDVKLNDSLFYDYIKIYKIELKIHEYPNWFTFNYETLMKYKSGTDKIFSPFKKNFYYPYQVPLKYYNSRNSLFDETSVLDLKSFKNVKLRILRSSMEGLLLYTSDSIIMGHAQNNEFAMNPVKKRMLKNLTTENKRKNLRPDSTFRSIKVIPKKFAYGAYYLSTLPFYKMGEIVFIDEKPFIHLNGFNSEGERTEPLDTIRSLSNNSLILYNHACLATRIELNNKLEGEARIKYHKYLSETFSTMDIEHIKSNKVYLGMSEKAMYESIGSPVKTNTTVTKTLTKKQCIYGAGIFVYLENGLITAWQNLESLRY